MGKKKSVYKTEYLKDFFENTILEIDISIQFC